MTNDIKTNMWVNSDGTEVLISSMSDYWLNNIRKMFKGEGRQNIQPIMDEIKRRKKIRKHIANS